MKHKRDYKVITLNFSRTEYKDFLAAWKRLLDNNGGSMCKESTLAKKILVDAVMGNKKDDKLRRSPRKKA
jgi:hypothetical protein